MKTLVNKPLLRQQARNGYKRVFSSEHSEMIFNKLQPNKKNVLFLFVLYLKLNFKSAL